MALTNVIRLSWKCKESRLHLPLCLMKGLQIRLYCYQSDLEAAKKTLDELSWYIKEHDLTDPIILNLRDQEKKAIAANELLESQVIYMASIGSTESQQLSPRDIEEIHNYINQARQIMMMNIGS